MPGATKTCSYYSTHNVIDSCYAQIANEKLFHSKLIVIFDMTAKE